VRTGTLAVDRRRGRTARRSRRSTTTGARRRAIAALLAATAGLSGIVTLAADANATRVSSKPSGNAGLDDYCRQAADLINEAFAKSEREEVHGSVTEGAEWWALALELLNAAKDRGCTFTAARTQIRGEVTTHSRVGLILTGRQAFDDFCRHAAAAINAEFASGDREGALGCCSKAASWAVNSW
jgi:hypothetical protein